MGWKKWVGLILLDTVLILPLVPDLIILYLGWRILVLLPLQLLTMGLYLVIRAFIFVFIELPLQAIGQSVRAISTFMRTGLDFFFVRTKSAILIAIIPFIILLSIFPVSFSNPFSMAEWIGNGFSIGIIAVGTWLATFTIARIYSGINDVDLSGGSGGAPGLWRGDTRSERLQNFTNDAKRYADIKNVSKGGSANTNAGKTYQNIQKTTGAKKTGKIPNDMIEIALALGNKIPLLGDALPGVGAAAGMSGGAAILIILLIIWVSAILFMALMAFWIAVIYFIVGPYIGILTSIFGTGAMATIGLGADYGTYGASVVNNKYLAGIQQTAEPAVDAYSEARSRVFCLLEGPGCLRNRTQEKPGSQDVGETYGLKIDRFQVGSAGKVDIQYENGDLAPPISFTLSNPRHGLKGIDARNVKFRIKIIDGTRGVDNPYCNTGWLHIKSGFNEDNTPVEGGEPLKNDIYPGGSAATGFLRIDQDFVDDHVVNEQQQGDPITLKSCEMMQPSLGENKKAVLDLQYQYFSQATLQFEAMSEETLRNDPSVSKGGSLKQSITADTPAKAAINVDSPVLFRTQNGQREPVPFAVRAGVYTDVNFAVEELEIENSDYVDLRPNSNCDFENVGPGNVMRLNEQGRENMIFLADDSRNPEYYWFTDSDRPAAGCIMQLIDTPNSEGDSINDLSAQGETLTIGIRTNYTVRKQANMPSFNVLNSQCYNVNCPMISTLQHNKTHQDYNYKVRCSGPDTNNGCRIVGDTVDEWGDNTVKDSINKGTDDKIEEGEIAIAIEYIGKYRNLEGPGPAGVEYDKWKRVDRDLDNTLDEQQNEVIRPDDPGVLDVRPLMQFSLIQFQEVSTGDWDVKLLELSDSECENQDFSGRYSDENILYVSKACRQKRQAYVKEEKRQSCPSFGEQQCKNADVCRWVGNVCSVQSTSTGESSTPWSDIYQYQAESGGGGYDGGAYNLPTFDYNSGGGDTSDGGSDYEGGGYQTIN